MCWRVLIDILRCLERRPGLADARTDTHGKEGQNGRMARRRFTFRTKRPPATSLPFWLVFLRAHKSSLSASARQEGTADWRAKGRLDIDRIRSFALEKLQAECFSRGLVSGKRCKLNGSAQRHLINLTDTTFPREPICLSACTQSNLPRVVFRLYQPRE